MTNGPIADASPSQMPVMELCKLFDIAENLGDYPWQPFRDGVEIFRIYGDGISGPTAALLRYRETAPIPPHVHEGYEHIFILSGSQEDADGTVYAGTLRVHPPGTHHAGTGHAGCILLAIYEKPVSFL